MAVYLYGRSVGREGTTQRMRRFVVGIAFTLGSVALLLRLIDWRTALEILQHADLRFIGLAVVSLLISLSLKTLRWRFLLPSDAGVSIRRLFRILHISFMLNNILPARLGDVARVAMTSRQPGLRVGSVLSSLLTERVTDSVTLLTCFVLVSPLLPIPDAYANWLERAWYALAVVAVLLVLSILLHRHVARMATHIPLPGRIRTNERLRDEARSFGAGWRQLFTRRLIVPVWGSSAMAWVGAFTINYLLLQALDIDAPLAASILLTCTTNLAMLVPSSPGYIGVFHAAATLSLIPFDVDATRALSFAIVAHLVNVLPVSILGALFLLAGKESISLRWGHTPVEPIVVEVDPRA